ncbi:MAG: Mrp/NBP35 family ATP-binding protein [Chloroflexi bacterium]|nr:Mrp/NBP35 family ATP-binding protein [Chloroflexota bacterium]
MEREHRITEEDIRRALSGVQEPELGKDLVSLGMIENVKVSDGRVGFTLVLTTPACPLKTRITEEARAAVLALPGVNEVEVDLISRVPDNNNFRGPLNGVRNTIAVASGKGGVGKTTVSVNLAVALAETGARVGLLDADIYGPSVPIMMGLSMLPDSREDGRIVPLTNYGVRYVSFGFFSGDTPVIWRGPMVGKAIQQLLVEVDWGELDYLVIDLPPGTGDASITLGQAIPLTGVIIVSTPQDVALADATKALIMFQKLEVPILGIVENMSYFVCPHCQGRTDVFNNGGGRRASQRLHVPFLGEVPLSMEVRSGGDEGIPILKAQPQAPEAEAFRRIAGSVAAAVSVQDILQVAGERHD